MKREMNKEYRVYANINNDSTSVHGFNRKVYTFKDENYMDFFLGTSEYIKSAPQNFNVFNNVMKRCGEIQNPVLRERLLLFIKMFTDILNRLSDMPNMLPAFVMTVEDDSIFLEWVFKDFRIGFTFCEYEEESMWFLVSNRNLEELSVSGDLIMSNYYSIITKVIIFVLRNT